MESKAENRRWVITLSDENRVQFVICLTIFGLYLRNASYMLGILSASTKSLIATGIKGAILISLVVAIIPIVRRLPHLFYLITVSSFVGVFLHYLLLPQNNKYLIDTIETFLTTIFPVVLCALTIKDFDTLSFKLKKTAYIISIVNVLFLLLYLRGNFTGRNYSMGYGDAMLFPTNYMIYTFFVDKSAKKKNALTMFLIVTDLLSVLLYGSRGPFISVFFFWIILLMSQTKHNEKLSSLVLKIAIIAAALLLIIFRIQLVSGMAALLSHFGYTSRTLISLSKDVISDSGRNDIWRMVIEEFSKNPFVFHGINGDYVLTGNNYSHNLYLELLFSFGLIIGGALCVLLTTMFVKTIRQSTGIEDDMCVIFLLGFFPSCMWSGSLWTNMYFWLWLGCYIVCRSLKRQKP